MPYSVPISTKILTLATAPFLFISVGILCLSVNLLWCQVCTFYCHLRKKRSILLPEGTDVHIRQHIHQKDLNLCLPLYYYGKVIAELEKTQTRNLTQKRLGFLRAAFSPSYFKENQSNINIALYNC